MKYIKALPYFSRNDYATESQQPKTRGKCGDFRKVYCFGLSVRYKKGCNLVQVYERGTILVKNKHIKTLLSNPSGQELMKETQSTQGRKRIVFRHYVEVWRNEKWLFLVFCVGPFISFAACTCLLQPFCSCLKIRKA